MMKKIFFAAMFLLSMAVAGNAQNYKSAIGARLGYPLSASFKTFINERGAIEAFAGFRGWTGYRWFNVGATYQHHSSLADVTEGLSWFVGGGASAYFWSFDNGFLNDGAGSTSIGILGIVGLDYKFVDAPVNISVDWMPAVFVNGYGSGFGAGYGGLSVRYVFK